MSDIVEQNDIEQQKQEVEELPVLTGQRFLNIFRQLHIFPAEKKKQFDKELLSLNDEVLAALASIPGSSLLLDHLDELKGIIKKPYQKRSNNGSAPIGINPDNASSIAPVMDKSFAESLSASFAEIFKQMEEKHSSEMKELVSSMVESQKSLLGGQPISEEDGQNAENHMQQMAYSFKDAMDHQARMFSDMIEEQTKALTTVLSSQSSGIRQVAKDGTVVSSGIDTQTFANALSASLSSAVQQMQHNQSVEFKSLIGTIMNNQQLLADSLHSSPHTSNDASSAQVMSQLAETMKNIVDNQSKMFANLMEMQTKSITSVLATYQEEQKKINLAQIEALKNSTLLTQVPQAKKQPYIESKNEIHDDLKNNGDNIEEDYASILSPIDSAPESKENTDTDIFYQNEKGSLNENENNTFVEPIDENIDFSTYNQEYSKESDDDDLIDNDKPYLNDDLSAIADITDVPTEKEYPAVDSTDTQVKKKKKKKKKNKNKDKDIEPAEITTDSDFELSDDRAFNVDGLNSDSYVNSDDTSDSLQDNTETELSVEPQQESEPLADISFDNSSAPAYDDEGQVATISNEDIPENTIIDDASLGDIQENELSDADTMANIKASLISPSSDIHDFSQDNWNWSDLDSIDDTPKNQFIDYNDQNNAEQEIPSPSQDETPSSTVENNEQVDNNQDWEWDYEEVPEGSENDQDWEWDYEEVPIDDAEKKDDK